MILIEENFNGIVAEASKDSKKTYLRGVFAEAITKNRNGRIYSRDDIQSAVTKVNEAAQLGRHILGELDHPNTLEIKLKNVSHRMMEMWMEGDIAMGKAEIIEGHPNGAIAKSLLDAGIQLGVSTRGSGSVNENSGHVTGFNFVTADIVCTPSARSAYPETIQEQLEMYGRGEVVKDVAESMMHDPMAQRYFQIEMGKFINSLKSKS